MELLTEKFAELLESSKYAPVKAQDQAIMALMLEAAEREERALKESTMAGDVAQFTPIIMPMVRRVYPALIANELLGVQAMTSPTGFIYALRNRYTGDDGVAGKISPTEKGQIIVADAAVAVGDVITGTTSGATGTVVYVEGDKALIKLTGVASFSVEAYTNSSLVNGNIDAVYSNESSFKRILKNYTGSHTTAAGEILGKDMKEMGLSIEKKMVEARTRKLKAQYTQELYTDLKNQHGLLADEELMGLMSYEMQAEMDREVVDFVNSNATQLADTSAFTAIADASGRWSIEKFRNEVIRISMEAKQIGLDTKRGQGNILLVSPKVATMLEQVGSFKVAEQLSGVSSPVSGGLAGMFDGKYKVVVDQYAESDYVTVMYKGADRRDAMGFLAPYVPLTFQPVQNPDSGQPAIIASMRYALDTTPIDPQAYARSYGIDFGTTVLARK